MKYRIFFAVAIAAAALSVPGFAGEPAPSAIERNKAAMRRFETCINQNDLALGRKLISEKAAFATPVSPEPLYGAEGYLSVVSLMRASFPDVQWKLEGGRPLDLLRHVHRTGPLRRTRPQRPRLLHVRHELLRLRRRRQDRRRHRRHRHARHPPGHRRGALRRMPVTRVLRTPFRRNEKQPQTTRRTP